jgi:Sec-independent protein secretion pathway component TatC
LLLFCGANLHVFNEALLRHWQDMPNDHLIYTALTEVFFTLQNRSLWRNLPRFPAIAAQVRIFVAPGFTATRSAPFGLS